MKRFFYTLALLVMAIHLYGQVRFNFSGGIDDVSLKRRAENNISNLLTEINNAQKSKRAICLNNINMTTTAKKGLMSLWKFLPFKCEHTGNVQDCLKDVTGFEVRGIPVEMFPLDNTYKGLLHKELIISFDKSGIINGVRMSIDNHSYQQLMENGISVDDISQRREILKFVADFCSYYVEKNLGAIENIFSDKALIITGRVVQLTNDSHSEVRDPRKKVIFTKQNKSQYLANLKRVFHENRYINVKFEDIQLMRHSSKKDIYGVRLRQKWSSQKYNGQIYSDDGCLFLLWDFTNKDKPKIHVRSWTQYSPKLTDNDLLSPDDFEL